MSCTSNCTDFDQCECPWNNGPEKDSLVSIFFWLDGVSRLVIAGIGIFGNIFTISILSSGELRSTFHIFLVILACFDLGYLFLTFLEEVPQIQDIITQNTTYPDKNCKLNEAWAVLYPYFIHPVQYIFLTSSEYLTVAISIDRFIAIKYPLRYYYLWNSTTFNKEVLNRRVLEHKGGVQKANGAIKVDWNRIGCYSFPVFLISILYCTPVFFELNPNRDGVTGTTVEGTSMTESLQYVIGYYVILDCIARCILPVFILLFTNYHIYKIVQNQPMAHNNTVHQKRAQNMMLFGIVALLMVVHLYRFGGNLYQFIILEYLKCCEYYSKRNLIIHMVGYVLLAINASGNWIIYLAASKRFRLIALERYKLLMTKFIAVYRRVEKSYHGNDTDPVIYQPKLNKVKPTLTPLTPFGAGYISWGNSGAENIQVVVSQSTAKRNKVTEVSVNII